MIFIAQDKYVKCEYYIGAEMRMWMIKPELLCKQHLLGEHFEIHTAIGNLRSGGSWTRNLTLKGFLEPQNALERHKELVDEMIKRGWKHDSELMVDTALPIGKVDTEKSLRD